MNVEFEEFDSIEDIFLYMSAIAPPMKNYLPINSYKGYICSIIAIERADKTYFVVMSPKRNTIADAAIKKL